MSRAGLGDPPRGPKKVEKPSQRLGGVGRPSWRAGRGGEALLEGQKGLRSPPIGPGGVESPSWRGTGGVERPYRLAGKCWEALPKGRKGREGLRCPAGWPGGVGKSFLWAGCS